MIYTPMRALTQREIQFILSAFQNREIKAELAKQIRVQIDAKDNRYYGAKMNYDYLTMGTVDMQNRLAASGYDTYGKTIMSSASERTARNDNLYRNLKNKIRYRSVPDTGYRDRGSYTIVR